MTANLILFRHRWQWLTARLKNGSTQVDLDCGPDEVITHLMDSTRKLPRLRSKADDRVFASKGSAFVTGGPTNATFTAFKFTGYREGEWKLSPILDPDEIIKPRLVIRIVDDLDGTCSLDVRVNAFLPALAFFVLLAATFVLLTLGVIAFAISGIPIPGASFACFLMGGIAAYFAISIFQAAAKAQLDEQYLIRWLCDALGGRISRTAFG